MRSPFYIKHFKMMLLRDFVGRLEIRSSNSFRLDRVLLAKRVKCKFVCQKIFLQRSLPCCSFKRPLFRFLERKARMKDADNTSHTLAKLDHVEVQMVNANNIAGSCLSLIKLTFLTYIKALYTFRYSSNHHKRRSTSIKDLRFLSPLKFFHGRLNNWNSSYFSKALRLIIALWRPGALRSDLFKLNETGEPYKC